MKRKTKVIITSLIALSTVITAIPVVNATVFSYKRATGIFNAYYDSSVAQKNYTTQFDWARTQWSAVSSKVSIGKTTNATTATDQYHVSDTLLPGHYGQTNLFTKNGAQVNPNLKNWDYSIIYIFHNNMVTAKFDNDTNKKNVATHEVGHSLGLAHTQDINSTLRSQSVMTAASDPFVNHNVTSPSTYDKDELKYIWGN